MTVTKSSNGNVKETITGVTKTGATEEERTTDEFYIGPDGNQITKEEAEKIKQDTEKVKQEEEKAISDPNNNSEKISEDITAVTKKEDIKDNKDENKGDKKVTEEEKTEAEELSSEDIKVEEDNKEENDNKDENNIGEVSDNEFENLVDIPEEQPKENVKEDNKVEDKKDEDVKVEDKKEDDNKVEEQPKTEDVKDEFEVDITEVKTEGNSQKVEEVKPATEENVKPVVEPVKVTEEEKVEEPAKEAVVVTPIDGYTANINSSIQFRITGDDIKIDGLDGINYSFDNGILTISTGAEATILSVDASNSVNSVSFDIIINGVVNQ